MVGQGEELGQRRAGRRTPRGSGAAQPGVRLTATEGPDSISTQHWPGRHSAGCSRPIGSSVITSSTQPCPCPSHRRPLGATPVSVEAAKPGPRSRSSSNPKAANGRPPVPAYTPKQRPRLGPVPNVQHYKARLLWRGSTGLGCEAYDREHEVTAPPAEAPLRLTTGEEKGDPRVLNPERLVVAAASSAGAGRSHLGPGEARCARFEGPGAGAGFDGDSVRRAGPGRDAAGSRRAAGRAARAGHALADR